LFTTLLYSVVDVGGMRNERKKWIHCFDNISYILYVVNIAEYDQTLYEDSSTNRLKESILLFSEVVNNRWLYRVPIILLMNKCDILKRKIEILQMNNSNNMNSGNMNMNSSGLGGYSSNNNNNKFIQQLFNSSAGSSSSDNDDDSNNDDNDGTLADNSSSSGESSNSSYSMSESANMSSTSSLFLQAAKFIRDQFVKVANKQRLVTYFTKATSIVAMQQLLQRICQRIVVGELHSSNGGNNSSNNSRNSLEPTLEFYPEFRDIYTLFHRSWTAAVAAATATLINNNNISLKSNSVNNNNNNTSPVNSSNSLANNNGSKRNSSTNFLYNYYYYYGSNSNSNYLSNLSKNSSFSLKTYNNNLNNSSNGITSIENGKVQPLAVRIPMWQLCDIRIITSTTTSSTSGSSSPLTPLSKAITNSGIKSSNGK